MSALPPPHALPNAMPATSAISIFDRRSGVLEGVLSTFATYFVCDNSNSSSNSNSNSNSNSSCSSSISAVVPSPVLQMVAPSSKGLTCRVCSLSFASLSEQQAHFKSDSHVSKLTGRSIDSKLSSSTLATSSSDESGDDESDNDEGAADSLNMTKDLDDDFDPSAGGFRINATATLTKTYDRERGSSLRFISCSESPPSSNSCNNSNSSNCNNSNSNSNNSNSSNSSSSSKLVTTHIIAASAAMIRMTETRSYELPHIDFNPVSLIVDKIRHYREHPIWIVIICRSGRFVGAVFKDDNLVTHQSYRRYTVRGKAGGSQNKYDSKYGKANSIGSQLRRQGEKSLHEDIYNLLTQGLWVDHIRNSSLILVSVPKRNRLHLFPFFQDEACKAKVQLIPNLIDDVTLESVINIQRICSSLNVSESTAVVEAEVAVVESGEGVEIGNYNDKNRVRNSNRNSNSNSNYSSTVSPNQQHQSVVYTKERSSIDSRVVFSASESFRATSDTIGHLVVVDDGNVKEEELTFASGGAIHDGDHDRSASDSKNNDSSDNSDVDINEASVKSNINNNNNSNNNNKKKKKKKKKKPQAKKVDEEFLDSDSEEDEPKSKTTSSSSQMVKGPQALSSGLASAMPSSAKSKAYLDKSSIFGFCSNMACKKDLKGCNPVDSIVPNHRCCSIECARVFKREVMANAAMSRQAV